MKKKGNFNGGHCVTCVHCYDHFSPAIDGHMILGKCRFKDSSVLLKWDRCDLYKKK